VLLDTMISRRRFAGGGLQLIVKVVAAGLKQSVSLPLLASDQLIRAL
jgi:hypothetical protein